MRLIRESRLTKDHKTFYHEMKGESDSLKVRKKKKNFDILIEILHNKFAQEITVLTVVIYSLVLVLYN